MASSSAFSSLFVLGSYVAVEWLPLLHVNHAPVKANETEVDAAPDDFYQAGGIYGR